MRKEITVSAEQKSWSLISNLTYAQVDSWYGASVRDMKLSILTPKYGAPGETYPLLVWICGGAFQVMDQNVWMPQWTEFARQGYIVASVEYRTSNEAPFPAALEDVKAAIRYLRAHAERFCIDRDCIVVSGESAGGCLAGLAGVYSTDRKYDVGAYLEYSSAVQGVIDFYGVADFSQEELEKKSEELRKAEESFLGSSLPERKKEASVCAQVNRQTPPFLIFHGDADALVPVSQSELLYEKLLQAGVPADFYVLKGSGHGADEFYQDRILELVKEFINAAGTL